MHSDFDRIYAKYAALFTIDCIIFILQLGGADLTYSAPFGTNRIDLDWACLGDDGSTGMGLLAISTGREVRFFLETCRKEISGAKKIFVVT